MFRPALALFALLSAAACADVDGVGVTRAYTGSLSGCPGLTGVSALYSRPVNDLPVRCGPQAAHPVTFR